MEALDEPEAKASMIWILGEYVSRPQQNKLGGGYYIPKKMPLYGSKDPLLGKKLRVQFGRVKMVKYLLRRYLDTKNMNNASIFLRLEQKDGRVQYVFSWVESTMCASH